MDILFLAALAVWFSGRAVYLTYQKRANTEALVRLTFENIVLTETLDYAHDTLSKIDRLEGECLKAFYEKTSQRHTDELESSIIRQL